MVFVNNKKFACESCIKGHRSSSCHHSDRPLFEVKKKGRPVSQCQQCRELRKAKGVHSRCECPCKQGDQAPAVRQLTANAKRYIAVNPTLPNGLKDVYEKSAPLDPPSDTRAALPTLLNPCTCKDVWTCKCRPSSNVRQNASDSGLSRLATLANAAALCCDHGGPPFPQEDHIPPIADSSSTVQLSKRRVSHVGTSSPKSQMSKSPKRLRRRSPSPQASSPVITDQRGPDLPPITIPPLSQPGDTPVPPPVFPPIPSLSSVASIAGTGCTCGFRCLCPGCMEHRGAEHASHEFNDCADGCGHCVDYAGGVELPTHSPSCSSLTSTLTSKQTGAATNFIDSFFARAATLPPPPASRSRSRIGSLDPRDVTVYPRSLFAGDSKYLEERGPSFGLVQIPKLECCSGRCTCPPGECGCGDACDGCGDEERSDSREEFQEGSSTIPTTTAPIPESCCCGPSAESS